MGCRGQKRIHPATDCRLCPVTRTWDRLSILQFSRTFCPAPQIVIHAAGSGQLQYVPWHRLSPASLKLRQLQPLPLGLRPDGGAYALDSLHGTTCRAAHHGVEPVVAGACGVPSCGFARRTAGSRPVCPPATAGSQAVVSGLWAGSFDSSTVRPRPPVRTRYSAVRCSANRRFGEEAMLDGLPPEDAQAARIAHGRGQALLHERLPALDTPPRSCLSMG